MVMDHSAAAAAPTRGPGVGKCAIAIRPLNDQKILLIVR